MQNFKRRCISWFSIPEDEDAKGIVVRVLNYTYYLKPILLTFKDPYIEVEYQIATRRIRLHRLTIVCWMHAFISLQVFLSPYLYDLPKSSTIMNDINIYALIQWNAIIFFVNCMGHLVITRCNRFAHITPWPTIFCIINLIITTIFILMNIETLIIKDDPQSSDFDNLSVRFISRIDSMERGLYGTYVMYLIAFLLLTVPILDLRQFLGLAGCYTLVLMFVSYRMHSFYNTNFLDIHCFIMNAIFTVNKMPNISKEIVHGTIEASYPYKDSYFNLQRYQRYSLTHYIYIWILMMITMIWVVYNQELSLRADFILRRVRSTKDAQRNLDGGIRIQEMVDEHESATDVRIRADNLATWKKANSDSNGNTIVTPELEDIGEAIPQQDAISIKSNTTFNHEAITAAVSGFVPQTYTKSVVSDQQDNLDNHEQN